MVDLVFVRASMGRDEAMVWMVVYRPRGCVLMGLCTCVRVSYPPCRSRPQQSSGGTFGEVHIFGVVEGVSSPTFCRAGMAANGGRVCFRT